MNALFQYVLSPFLAPIILFSLVYLVKKEYFGKKRLRYVLETSAFVFLALSVFQMISTLQFSGNFLTAKVLSNEITFNEGGIIVNGWYAVTFLLLLGILTYGAFKYKSLLIGFLLLWSALGLHEFFFWLTRFNLNIGLLSYALVTFPAPFLILYIFKAKWKFYLLPMILYTSMGMIFMPSLFSRTTNDLLGWIISCLSCVIGLSSKIKS